MAGEAFRAGRNRLEPTVAGRVWAQLSQLGFMNSSLQFAALFTLGFIPFLMVLSVALGPGLSRAIVIGNGFSDQAGHDVTVLFSPIRASPASLSVLAILLAVLGGSAACHMIQAWYGKIFRTQIHGWKAMACRAEWLAGAFGFVALQAVVVGTIQPTGGHIAAAVAQFLLPVAFWWWSPHCLLAGQVPWRRLFIAGVATAVCCTGLGVYIACLASSSLVSNEASYGPFGAVMTLVTAEIGLGVALHLGAVIGATIGPGKDQATAVRADPGHRVTKDGCHDTAAPPISLTVAANRRASVALPIGGHHGCGLAQIPAQIPTARARAAGLGALALAVAALALPGVAVARVDEPGTSGHRQRPQDHDYRRDHGADLRIIGDSPQPEPRWRPS